MKIFCILLIAVFCCWMTGCQAERSAEQAPAEATSAYVAQEEAYIESSDVQTNAQIASPYTQGAQADAASAATTGPSTNAEVAKEPSTNTRPAVPAVSDASNEKTSADGIELPDDIWQAS